MPRIEELRRWGTNFLLGGDCMYRWTGNMVSIGELGLLSHRSWHFQCPDFCYFLTLTSGLPLATPPLIYFFHQFGLN
jgi:hypothetical protein